MVLHFVKLTVPVLWSVVSLYWIIVTCHYSNIIRASKVFMKECAQIHQCSRPGVVDSWYAGIDVTSAVLSSNKGNIVHVFRKDSCVQVLGLCPGCSHSFMSSYTGLLLLPWEVPISVADRQPFNDLRQRLSPCGQVRAFCITTHCSHRSTDRFPQAAPLKYCVSFRAECGFSQITETQNQLAKHAPCFSVHVQVIGSLTAVGLMILLTMESQNRIPSHESKRYLNIVISVKWHAFQI